MLFSTEIIKEWQRLGYATDGVNPDTAFQMVSTFQTSRTPAQLSWSGEQIYILF